MDAQTIVYLLIAALTALALLGFFIFATRADKRDEEHEAIGDASSLDHSDTKETKAPKYEVEPRGA